MLCDLGAFLHYCDLVPAKAGPDPQILIHRRSALLIRFIKIYSNVVALVIGKRSSDVVIRRVERRVVVGSLESVEEVDEVKNEIHGEDENESQQSSE